MRWLATLFVGLSIASSGKVLASAIAVPLQQARVDFCDKASLQRGAGLFMNYCAGCHSLQYVRYSDMANDLMLVDKEGNRLDNLIKTHLNFVSDKVTDPIVHAMPNELAEKWFGVQPPDLSLVTRSRGADWLYTYLKSFYRDDKRPFGVNNALFQDVAMPHVLVELQGVQEALWDDKHITGYRTETPGLMSDEEYDQAVNDLVNFLDYIGEPSKAERKHLGVFVVLFLIFFTVLAYLLKREYWKDVH